MIWFITINTLLPLACEAIDPATAKHIFASSPLILAIGQPNAQGQPTFGYVPVPEELRAWLAYSPPKDGWERVPGGWLTFTGHVPVWGAAGLTVVVEQRITLPPGTMPSAQGWPNG